MEMAWHLLSVLVGCRPIYYQSLNLTWKPCPQPPLSWLHHLKQYCLEAVKCGTFVVNVYVLFPMRRSTVKWFELKQLTGRFVVISSSSSHECALESAAKVACRIRGLFQNKRKCIYNDSKHLVWQVAVCMTCCCLKMQWWKDSELSFFKRTQELWELWQAWQELCELLCCCWWLSAPIVVSWSRTECMVLLPRQPTTQGHGSPWWELKHLLLSRLDLGVLWVTPLLVLQLPHQPLCPMGNPAQTCLYVISDSYSSTCLQMRRPGTHFTNRNEGRGGGFTCFLTFWGTQVTDLDPTEVDIWKPVCLFQSYMCC